MPEPCLPIAFVDCETTHLDAEIGEAWEVAVILREDNDPATDTEYVWEFSIDPETVDAEALRVGRWHERRQLPARTDQAAFTGSVPAVPMARAEAVKAIVNVLRGAVLVGSNPGFDDRFLRKLLGPGSAQWHYRPYDIVQLAAAKIGAQAAGPLPWRAHVLSRAVGVEPPTAEAAHTALGDARWARDVYDAVMVREKFPLSWEGRARHAIGLYTQTAIELEDTRRDLAASTATVARLRERHKDSLRRADEINNELMAEVQRYAEGTERPVLWSVYNQMHSRAAFAEAAVERIRERCQAVRDRVGPGGMINASQILGLLSPTWPDGNFEAPAPADALDRPSQPLPEGFTREACVTVKCAVCEYEFDEDESSTIHFEDIDTAHATLRGYDWTVLADGRALCPDDDAEHQALREPGDDPSTPVSPDQTAICTCTLGEPCGCDSMEAEDDDQADDEDGDVLALISEIAGRLRDATDGGEYHAVGLISDLANGRTTIADARTELADITFRHV